MFRALHKQHLHPSGTVGRVCGCKQAPAQRPRETGPMERCHEEQPDPGQWLGSADSEHSAEHQRSLQNGLGDQAEAHHRYGRRPRCLHLPVAVAEHSHSGFELWQAHIDALLRLESGSENGYVLPPYEGRFRRREVHRCTATGGATTGAGYGRSGNSREATRLRTICQGTRYQRRTHSRADGNGPGTAICRYDLLPRRSGRL